jgi:hypothetical protein
MGRLFFSPLEELSIENILAIRHRMPGAAIGLIGTKARRVGSEISLQVEHRFDAYDEALIEISHGRDFVLIGDGSWKGQVQKRLQAMNRDLGTDLELSSL